MNDDANKVDPQHACPLCGERRTDQLVWIDDERVRCLSCGTVYHVTGEPFSRN